MVGVPATGAGAGSTPVAQQPSRVRIGPVVPVVRFDTHHLKDALERKERLMDWSHFACLTAGGFVGVFLMTVWRNERRYRREQDALRLGAMNRRR